MNDPYQLPETAGAYQERQPSALLLLLIGALSGALVGLLIGIVGTLAYLTIRG